MKNLLIAGASAFALVSLSACGAITPLFSAPPGASPETQAAVTKAKADADAAFVKALTDKLAHCSLTGSISIGLGGIAATGTGFANTAQLTCPGQAYGTNDFTSGLITLPQLSAGGGSFGGGGATITTPQGSH